MSISNKNYLIETFPNFVHTQLDQLAERVNSINKQERIKLIIEQFCELKNLSIGLATKLKTEDGFMLYPKIISDNYIIEFKEIKQCHLRQNEMIYFQAWSFQNLNQIELYMLQTLLRLQCIQVQFECKKYFDTQKLEYKQIYNGDLTKIFLLIQTQQSEFQITADSFFFSVLQQCKSKNKQFITYLNKLFKGKNMLKCILFLEEQKLSQKVSREKKREFKQYRDNERSKKESLKDSQQISQQISSQISQIFPQSQQNSKTVRRTQSLIQNKSNDQFNQLSRIQDTSRDITTYSSMINRPSTITRTIKDGINHKYKRENEFRQQRQLQNEVNQQRVFQKEVNRKVDTVKKRTNTCWNSDCLAPETPELFSD